MPRHIADSTCHTRPERDAAIWPTWRDAPHLGARSSYPNAVKEYYDARAEEYDEWYLRLGRFDGLERPRWDEELHELEGVIAGLPAKRTLDVACGTGFLTRHLPGELTGLDHSARMLKIAGERMPDAHLIVGDALDLPFADGSFERVVTGHFYGHLDTTEQLCFLEEARRVAPELVVIDAALRPDRRPAEHQPRTLNNGACYQVYKRYFDADSLASELGGGTVLFSGRWFVVVLAPNGSGHIREK